MLKIAMFIFFLLVVGIMVALVRMKVNEMQQELEERQKEDSVTQEKFTYAFASDPAVCDAYHYSFSAHQKNLEQTSLGDYGYGTFEDFKVMYDKWWEDGLKDFNPRSLSTISVNSKKGNEKFELVSYNGQIMFDKKCMVFKEKGDWELVQKYIIYKELERRKSKEVNWGDITGIEKKAERPFIPAQKKKSNWENIAPVIASRVSSINSRYALCSKYTNHANLILVEDSMRRIKSIIERAGEGDATQELIKSIFSALGSIETALEDTESTLTKTLVAELDVEKKTVQTTMEMNG